MTLKAITFDLWLTLIWDSKELEDYRKLRRLVNFHRYANKIHNNSGIKEAPFKFQQVRLAMEALAEKAKERYREGKDIHPNERGKMLFEMLKINVEEQDREEIYARAGTILSNSGYMRKFPSLNPEARPTFKALKKEFPNLKIALVSNAARSTRTYVRTLKALGVGHFFDHFVISCEVGYLKPRKEIFETALKLLDVDPKETIHVGDLFRADVIGANEAGMNACLYSGLWHKYAQYMNPGERIPSDYNTRNLVAEEIEHLQDLIPIARTI